MGIGEFGKRRAESYRESRLHAAKVLDSELKRLVESSKQQKATRFDPDTIFYPDIYRGHGPLTEVRASETYAKPKLWGEYAEVAERLFDHPETGEALKAHFFRAETLPRDRSNEGISGPVGIIIYLDDNDEVTDVQAKCSINEQQADAPAAVLLDIAVAIEGAGGHSDIEFKKLD